MFLSNLNVSNNNIKTLNDIENLPNIITNLNLKNNPITKILSKEEYYKKIQLKFPNLKYLDGEEFIKNDIEIIPQFDMIKSFKPNEIEKEIIMYKSRIESLEQIINIQENAIKDNSPVINKWREKVMNLLVQNKTIEQEKDCEISKLKKEIENFRKIISTTIQDYYIQYEKSYIDLV